MTSSRRPAGAPDQPVAIRCAVPPYAVTASSVTLSAVVPQATEWAPHALLPIMPPRVQRECVDGSGPKVSPCGRTASRSRSRTSPGWTTAVRAAGSTDTRPFMCRVRSRTTPTPVAWPHDGGSAAARHDRDPGSGAHREGGRHVVGVARGDHAHRHTAVVGGVHGGQGPCGGAEVDLPAQVLPQCPFEFTR